MYQSRSCMIKKSYGASLSNTLTFFIVQKMFYQALLGQSMQEKKIQWQEVFELCRKCFIKHFQDKVYKRSQFNGKKFANCVENVLPSIFRTKYTREVNWMARSFPIVQKMFYGALLGQSMQEKKIQWQEIFQFFLFWQIRRRTLLFLS